MQYPEAPRLDLVDDYHGTRVPDPYRWLEDPSGYPSDAPAEEWQQWRKAWEASQADLFAEHSATWTTRGHFTGQLRSLLAGGYQGLPTWRGERQFFMRRLPGQQLGVLLTVDPDGSERVLIDPIALDPAGTTTLDGYAPSREGDRLAYQLSEGGDEESVLRIMDVATGETIDGPIDRTRFSSIGWLPGGERFYYVRSEPPGSVPTGEEAFHRRVRLHTIGAEPDDDPEIFGAGLTMTNYYSASVTRDGRWLVIEAAEGTAPRNDVYLADLSQHPADAPVLQPVVVGRDANTSITIRPDDRMFVWTDHDAPRGALFRADPHHPEPEHWTALLTEDPAGAVLEGFRLSDGPDRIDQFLVARYAQHTVGSLRVLDAESGSHVSEVPLPGPGTVAGPVGRPEGGSENWFVYTDHTTQPHIHRHDTVTGETMLWARPPGLVDVPAVHSRQLTYRSGDGTEIRMTVISPTGEPDRPRPTILYGYGGFGISLSPAFNPAALAWVSAGGVFAIANLRGGNEEGEQWHRAGMLAGKQRVFDDFHAAAERLIEQHWTTPAQLCIEGGSNGGLLVGAAITQRPELYGSVICQAPLLDMIRYVTSQLGATWTVEYGDPADPEQFGWLWGYSPYHHVRVGERYPSVLMMVFDNDTRTDPMHGRKFVAALQHATAGAGPVLLRAESDVGHGARSLDRSVASTADALAFAAAATGLEPEA